MVGPAWNVGDRNAYMLIEILKGKKQCGRSKRKRNDNIKTDFRKLMCEGLGCINLVRDRERWMEFVKMVMNFWACMKQGGIYRMIIVKFSIKSLLRGVSRLAD
jgi:hypothetical protein